MNMDVKILTEEEGEYISRLIRKDVDKSNYTNKERKFRIKLDNKIISLTEE